MSARCFYWLSDMQSCGVLASNLQKCVVQAVYQVAGDSYWRTVLRESADWTRVEQLTTL